MDNQIDNFIPQVYCKEDLNNCINAGYNKCLLALWKKFPNIFSKPANASLMYWAFSSFVLVSSV